MRANIAIPLLSVAALTFGCADMGSLGGTKNGETSGTVAGGGETARVVPR